jgi:hypothetical protein
MQNTIAIVWAGLVLLMILSAIYNIGV